MCGRNSNKQSIISHNKQQNGNYLKINIKTKLINIDRIKDFCRINLKNKLKSEEFSN